MMIVVLSIVAKPHRLLRGVQTSGTPAQGCLVQIRFGLTHQMHSATLRFACVWNFFCGEAISPASLFQSGRPKPPALSGMSKRGRTGQQGTKFAMTLALPVGAVVQCADNSGAKTMFVISCRAARDG
jgi:hypothetical protein